MEATYLHCPIRGKLKVKQRATDQLTFTEEKQRIDAVRYLLHKGYPEDNFAIETTLFRLGNAGRNAFRTDFAVYDEPFLEIKVLPLEERVEHLRLLAEIKRDNSTAEQAKATQVKSALRLVPDNDALGVYWDDIEQRFFYKKDEGRRENILEAPISKIPAWGRGVSSTELTYADLEEARDLVKIFDEIEDALHTYIVDNSARYTLIQQLLLLKIFDENGHKAAKMRSKALDFQDFSSAAISDTAGLKIMNDALSKAAEHYNVYLPKDKKIKDKFDCNFEALRNATKILAPINVLSSKAQVIQQFYMKFAKSLYKWDLAQYFTPHEVIDFIVEFTNPQSGEHVYDPACGSADFLISAFRRCGTPSDPCVWGADHSAQAVQVSILNMVMNGDGKTQIARQDSLVEYRPSPDRLYDVVLCNPPFGTKIVEKRFEVLRKFDMGYQWERTDAGVNRGEIVRESQQTGILFTELCVRLAKDGGRVGLILPNGYLGNRSIEYVALREWLLRHTKLVAIVAFPRFTFKKSGADVSASAVILERRKQPLASAADSADYGFFNANIESVGWRAGDKTAVPIYVRDEESGELILDEDNEPVLDADFSKVLSDYLRSPCRDDFPWTVEGREDAANGAQTAAVEISEVAALPDLNLDPKRYAQKFLAIRGAIMSKKHFRLGDVFEIVPNERVNIVPSTTYKYVEIENIGIGEYDFEEVRGWRLPSRARLPAAPGDIFIAHLWSSAGKWLMASGDCTDMLVTNGCARMRVKREDMLPQLALGMCSEAFRIQLRGFATGSDGLAEISDEDMLKIVLPDTFGAAEVRQVKEKLRSIRSGDFRFSRFAGDLIASNPNFRDPPKRKIHWSLL